MKSLKNKKGFTIVELVIVIAVIAILAAVLIPTFSNIVERANEAAAQADAKNLWTQYCVDVTEDNKSYADFNGYIVIDEEYYFSIEKGQLDTEVKTKTEAESKKPANFTEDGTSCEYKADDVDEDKYKGLKYWKKTQNTETAGS